MSERVENSLFSKIYLLGRLEKPHNGLLEVIITGVYVSVVLDLIIG